MELGKTVRSVIALEYAEGIEADTARRLSELWGRGLLRTPELREVAAGLIANTQGRQWCQMMLDEGWSILRAAEVLREIDARSRVIEARYGVRARDAWPLID